MGRPISLVVIGLTILLPLGGCGVLQRSSKAPQTGQNSSEPTVPRAQYDELKAKYEALLAKNAVVAEAPLQEAAPALAPAPAAPLEEVPMRPSGKETAALTETVDLLHPPTVTPEVAEVPAHAEANPVKAKDETDTQIEREIAQLKMIGQQIASPAPQGPETVKQLQTLENSSSKQVKARSKLLMGELLMKQKEYDLALQVLEDVIHHYAYSSIVLKALENLIVCTEHLKLEEKKAQYTSLLKDIFEQG